MQWYYLEDTKDSIKNAFVESSEIVKKWSDAGYFRKDYEGIDYGDTTTLFGQGQTAMSLDGNWVLYDYENTGLDVGVFAFPGVTDNTQENYIINPVDAAFAVGKQVDEKQKAVAFDFIDLMLTPEVAAQWLKSGSIPSLDYDFSDAEDVYKRQVGMCVPVLAEDSTYGPTDATTGTPATTGQGKADISITEPIKYTLTIPASFTGNTFDSGATPVSYTHLYR